MLLSNRAAPDARDCWLEGIFQMVLKWALIWDLSKQKCSVGMKQTQDCEDGGKISVTIFIWLHGYFQLIDLNRYFWNQFYCFILLLTFLNKDLSQQYWGEGWGAESISSDQSYIVDLTVRSWGMEVGVPKLYLVVLGMGAVLLWIELRDIQHPYI